jgi:hypothetical protein
MASTYSPLKIQLMTTGENLSTWGNVTNVNLGTALEEAIVGSADVTFASSDVTLTLSNTNASQTARNLRLNLVGTSGGARNLIVPSIEKVFIVNNGLADTVTVKTAAGTGIAIPSGKTTYVYCNAVNVVDGITHLTSLTLGTPLAVTQGGTGVTSLDGLAFSGENITALNASNVSSGTLANARTTGSTSNSANTLVLRDADGSFAGNVGTFNNVAATNVSATTVTAGTVNGTNLSGAGANITGLNASNISAGTLANARTTGASANGASTLVLRDASGNFSANTITANIVGSVSGTASSATTLQNSRNFSITNGVTASAVSFNGSADVALNVTAINASTIDTGTLANARTTGSSANGASTLVLRDASGDFTGRNVLATNFIGTLNGSGANVSSINAANISSGTLAVARGGTGASSLTANNVLLGNGTSAVQVVAPGTSGNVLTSNGTTWSSTAIPAMSTAQVLTAVAGASYGEVGTYSWLTRLIDGSTTIGSDISAASLYYNNTMQDDDGGGIASPNLVTSPRPSGTWRLMTSGVFSTNRYTTALWLRIL